MKSGDSFYFTSDFVLASALIAVGVKLLEGSEYFHTLKGGVEKVVWHFAERSETTEILTADALKWYKDKRWLEKHPTHVFTVAVHAAENFETLTGWISESIPYAIFSLGRNRELYAKLGTKDYTAAVESGARQL